MVSKEFKATVSAKNLLRTRIMLKDSFVIDPTFLQFDEMLSYARMHFPGLFDAFNGEYLEDDESKWNSDVMNEELVQLVTNFSETRVHHLKKVVSKVLEAEAAKLRRKRMEQPTRPQSTQPPTNKSSATQAKDDARRKALGILQNEAGKIQDIMTEVRLRGTWKSANVNDMECAARKICKAAQAYRKNK